MKRSCLFVCLFMTGILNAQVPVPQVTKALYGIIDATWCGNCGQYGHPATADIINQTAPKAIYVSLHRSGASALYSVSASNLATAWGVAGQPVFTVNGESLGSYSGAVVSQCVTAITNYYDPIDADVNAGFEYGIVGDTLYVRTTTTFITAMDGEYYLGVYVYEDSIWEWQVNYDPGIPDMDIWHNHVLRADMDGHFGQQIAAGSILAGTSFNRNFKMPLDSDWNSDQLHVFTVIWKKNGSAFEFVNANDTGSVITGQVNIPEQEQSSIRLYPNPVTDSFYIQGVEAENTFISVCDLSGKEWGYGANVNSLSVDHLLPGVYVVRVDAGGKISYYRLVKE